MMDDFSAVKMVCLRGVTTAALTVSTTAVERAGLSGALLAVYSAEKKVIW